MPICKFAKLGVAALIALSGVLPSRVSACSFDGVLAGGFTAVYPGSLSVAAAISNARDNKLIPTVNAEPSQQQLHRVFADMNSFRIFLSRRAGDVRQLKNNFSVVLISSGFWSAFHVENGDVLARFHLNGPMSGQPVIMTDASVVKLLVAGEMTVADALRLGVLSIANDKDRGVEEFLLASF